MHTRRALLVSDGAQAFARLRQVLSPLDLSFTECAAQDVTARLAEARIDLVVVDDERISDRLPRMVESAVLEGRESKVMIVIDPAAASVLQLPARPEWDFFVRGGTSQEFVTRVRALVWPGEEVAAQELVQVGDLTVDIAAHQVHRSGELLGFTYLECALLTFLVTHPGRVYSREVLLSRVWGTDYDGGPRTVDVHIRRVRSKIGAEMSDHLETVRIIGYLWRP